MADVRNCCCNGSGTPDRLSPRCPQPPCHDFQSLICCCQGSSNGCSNAEMASVAADSLLLAKPSASVARRGSSPISATLPGPACRYCHCMVPFRGKSCQQSLAPT